MKRACKYLHPGGLLNLCEFYMIPLTINNFNHMNHYPLHQFFIYNGKVKPNDTFIVSENTGGVYEVIRVTSGVPLFLSEHLKRLNNSAVIAGYKIPFSLEEISEFLRRLIQSN